MVNLTEQQAIKLQEENLDLKKKLANEDLARAKLLDVIKNKNEKISSLEEKIMSLEGTVRSIESELRWANDRVAQKELNVKAMKERMKKVEDENEELSRTVEIFRATSSTFAKKKSKDSEKPFLFGPDDSLVKPEF